MLRPTVFAATPTFYNGLYTQFQLEVRRNQLKQEQQEQQQQEKEEEQEKEEGQGKGQRSAIESGLLEEWRDRCILGNRIQVLISTGAPLRHHVQRWLVRVAGRMIINGYGTTETGGLASNGTITAGVEVRLVDCPELGYTTADKPFPRGEILARSPRMFEGYFNLDRFDATSGKLQPLPSSNSSSDGPEPGEGDGGESADRDWVTLNGVRYFRTGDIGERRPDGEIRVVDRCKAFFKLSQGVYVAPEAVEAVLMQSPLVSQVFVWGDGTMATVGAVVVPMSLKAKQPGDEGVDPQESEKHGQTQASRVAGGNENSTNTEEKEEVDQEHILRTILQSFRDLAMESGLKPWEVPQALVLADEPFTPWNGLLSSIGKHCRPALIRRYRSQLQPVDGNGTPSNPEPTSFVPLPLSSGLCQGLLEALAEALGYESRQEQDLSPSTSLLDLGLDSLAIARFSSALQTRFGRRLSPRQLFLLPTLGDIEAAVFGGEDALRRGVGL